MQNIETIKEIKVKIKCIQQNKGDEAKVVRNRELTTHEKLGRYQRLLFIIVLSELASGTCHVRFTKGVSIKKIFAFLRSIWRRFVSSAFQAKMRYALVEEVRSV